MPLHSSLNNLFGKDYSKPSILTSALVRTLDRHARRSRGLPAHAHPTSQAAPEATLTEIRHYPLPFVAVRFTHLMLTLNYLKTNLSAVLPGSGWIPTHFLGENFTPQLYRIIKANNTLLITQVSPAAGLIRKFTNYTNIIGYVSRQKLWPSRRHLRWQSAIN